MHCPSCYTRVGDDDRNCPKCGLSLSMWNAPSATPATPAAPVQDGFFDYAGFWVRFSAAVVDGLIFMLGYFVIAFGLGMVLGSQDMAIDENDVTVQVLDQLASLLLGWLYYALQEAGPHQATFGKRVMGIRVTGLDGGRITFLRATGRYFAEILSALTLMIGYIIAGFTPRKQALHDYIAGTLVVHGSARRSGGAIVGLVVVLVFLAVVGILAAVAIPAYQDYVKAAEEARTQSEAGETYYDEAYGEEQPEGGPAGDGASPDAVEAAAAARAVAAAADTAATAINDHFLALEELPESLDGYVDLPADGPRLRWDSANATLLATAADGSATLRLEGITNPGSDIIWICSAQGIDAGEMPASCASW